ncbi:MAG: NAD(P)H-hydrate dehydratase [Chitinophagaceae bacterium]|jgi:NAD(P)H-hydrate epimerase|nr:NAD(P)H-hydrate dehydratase [Chitinophagaceae bacterium]
MKKITQKSIQLLFKPREANTHKGNYGHALIIAGSMGCMGAAVFAAKACLRAGVGLLTINIPADERFILQTTIPEAMLLRRENIACDFKRFSAIGIGPGLGIDAVELLTHLLSQITQPLLLDADALNSISANTHLIDLIPPQTILTPHPKEFDRLFGMHKNDEERIRTAVQKAKELNLIIVLKGHRTIITNGIEIFQNTTGNAGLAKAGSGDSLTGIITAFLAQGYQPIIAAQIGVYLHGLAADITLQQQSMESMLITDVIENLGQAFKQIQS